MTITRSRVNCPECKSFTHVNHKLYLNKSKKDEWKKRNNKICKWCNKNIGFDRARGAKKCLECAVLTQAQAYRLGRRIGWKLGVMK